jgi:hypothetical protein
MNTHESTHQSLDATGTHNVIAFPARGKASRAPQLDGASVDMNRFPVDIRGHVTFGRLISGLSTVGLTVRVDVHSGRVVITDDAWED